MKDVSLAIRFALLWVPQAVYGQCLNLQLEIEPAAPMAGAPVTVEVSELCSTACHEVCRVEGSWVDSRHYHIDFFIQVTSQGCLQVLTPVTSEIELGPLEAGEYTITAVEYLAPFGSVCKADFPVAQAQAVLTVAAQPVPTASEWGFSAMTLLVLVAGALAIARRQRWRVGDAGGVIASVGKCQACINR